MVAAHEQSASAPRQTVDPRYGVLPIVFRRVGQLEELVKAPVGNGLRLQPGARNPAQLDTGAQNHPGQSDAAHGRGEPVEVVFRPAGDDLTITALKHQLLHMITERTRHMVILSVNVVGDGAAHRDQLAARCDGQHPATRHRQALYVPQQHTRFALEGPTLVVKPDEPVEATRHPEHTVRIEARIPVAATHAMAMPGPGGNGSGVPSRKSGWSSQARLCEACVSRPQDETATTGSSAYRHKGSAQTPVQRPGWRGP